LTVNGAAGSATTFDLGQKTHLRFIGTANQAVTLTLSNSTWQEGSYLRLIAPDGSYIYDGYAYSGPGTNKVVKFDDLEQSVLPATGEYQIELDPAGRGVGQGSVTVTSP
jgi:hypothetical protein